MEKIDKQTIGVLLRLLSVGNSVIALLMDLLTKEDILTLLSLNKEIRSCIGNNHHVINRLFYDACLRADKSMLVSAFADPLIHCHEHRQLTALSEQEQLNWKPQLKRLNYLLTNLQNGLAQAVEKPEAIAIRQDLQRVLREPDLPLPHLRHESVGTYCNSSFQVLLAELDWEGRAQQDQWQSETYVPLKKRLLQLSDNFKSQFDCTDAFLLKTLRYQAETLTAYNHTPSLLINIIQLIVLLVSNHLQGLSTYFNGLCNVEITDAGLTASTASTATNMTASLNKNAESVAGRGLSQSPFDFLVQFVTRYRMYRNTAIELEEKIGFIFRHFAMVFELCQPQYSMHPSFNLWRIMQKLWIIKMKKYHTLTNVIYTQLFLKQLELNTEALLSNHGAINSQQEEQSNTGTNILNNRIKCMYFSQKKPLSQTYAEKYFGAISNVKNMFLEADKQLEPQIFSQYTQYIVDLSINQYNVNWCGSSQQRLGHEYKLAEKQLMLAMSDFISQCHYVTKSVCVTKLVFQSALQYMEDKLKPPTLAWMIKQATDYLNELRTERIKEIECQQNNSKQKDDFETIVLRDWMVKVPDLGKRDRIIDCFTRERNLSQETGQQYSFLFDMDKTVKLDMLESLMRDNSDMDSEPQMQLIESYISNDSGVDHIENHELESPPKLILGRIQSMT